MQKVNPLSGTSTVVVYQAVFNGNIGELTGTSSFKPDSVVEPFNFHVFRLRYRLLRYASNSEFRRYTHHYQHRL